MRQPSATLQKNRSAIPIKKALPPAESRTVVLRRSFSLVGLLAGTLFFSASLSPSLVPRAALLQGVLSGVSFTIGYGIGTFLLWLWHYLELPVPGRRATHVARTLAVLICSVVALLFLWQAMSWQNSIRVLMEMSPLDGRQPLTVGAVALLVFLLLMVPARSFQYVFSGISHRLRSRVPRRVSNALAVLLAAALFWAVIDGILFRQAMRIADSSYEALDSLVDIEIEQPREDWMTGSDASLIDWANMGRRGREFIASGPSSDALSNYLGRPAMDPLRIYVGLRSADDVESRARLALDELVRVGAFDRAVLVVATPTGTGWMDPMAIGPLEYLHAGDVATVAVQYSYLASWLSLLVEPGYGAEASRALFSKVYNYWVSLPRQGRPKLYLFGLSLGALSSERSTGLIEVLSDPPQGAVWAGPPFATTSWRSITNNREPDSPPWLPRFRDGSIVRFTSQTNVLDAQGAEWGPVRIVYLQYASDPITFFEPSMFYRRPAWLSAPRGPDVSPKLRWYPIITGLQIGVDIVLATEVPLGFGHSYAPEHYIDAWVAVTEPAGWSPERISSLKRFVMEQR